VPEKYGAVSISPLENAEYKGTRGIWWEMRGFHPKIGGSMRLSPLENHRYAMEPGPVLLSPLEDRTYTAPRGTGGQIYAQFRAKFG
jgi:hypothetical protein